MKESSGNKWTEIVGMNEEEFWEKIEKNARNQ